MLGPEDRAIKQLNVREQDNKIYCEYADNHAYLIDELIAVGRVIVINEDAFVANE